jgi:hypothetical protein
MRPIAILSSRCLATLVASVPACSGSPSHSGFSGGSSSGGGSNSSGSGSGSFGSSSGSGGSSDAGGDVVVTTKITVYSHTDDTLYSVDPMSNTVTMIGAISGQGTDAVTDLAVNVNGDVYVNTETTLYKAAVPSSPGGVTLTQIAAISGGSGKFYALAFAPAGALDPNNETLVAGDSGGNLYSVNTTSGAATNLGNFGNDASNACGKSPCTFELSGDVVFYADSNNNPTGLATIRSCPSGSSTGCSADWLAGVNMMALKTAYTSGTPATSLLAGIYGGSGASLGSGTGFHDVFGLGAWDSTVFGFTRHMTAQSPSLITIDTGTGAGTLMGSPFSFTNGWSGAGVTTKVTISVPPPPPPPPNNQ